MRTQFDKRLDAPGVPRDRIWIPFLWSNVPGFKINSKNTLQRDENLERRSILQTLKLPSNPKTSIEPEKRVREISFVFQTTE
jgi:hypothetical protein